MNFKGRVVEFPNRIKLKKVPEQVDIYDIERVEGNVSVEGTALNVDTLKKINWRDDETLSFKIAQNSNLPAAKINETQIITKANGETWLVPPSNMGQAVQPVELGKITGTTLKDESGVDIVEAKIGTSFPSNAQMNNICSLSNSTFKTNLLNAVYPVSSVYTSVSPVNPGTFFGGTWIAFGAGRVLLGMGSNGESNYTTVKSTGGSENSVAEHTHIQNQHGHTQNSHSHNIYTASTAGGMYASNRFNSSAVISAQTSYLATMANSGIGEATPAINQATATNQNAGVAGGNRMPFITVYFWERTN